MKKIFFYFLISTNILIHGKDLKSLDSHQDLQNINSQNLDISSLDFKDGQTAEHLFNSVDILPINKFRGFPSLYQKLAFAFRVPASTQRLTSSLDRLSPRVPRLKYLNLIL